MFYYYYYYYYYNTRFACAPHGERCLQNVGILCFFAIETCILVEIDLQVYVCVAKVRCIGATVYFFFAYFAVYSKGRVSHVGTRTFSW